MTLLLLLRCHVYGPVAATLKGYTRTSDILADSAGSSDALLRSSRSTDQLADSASSEDA